MFDILINHNIGVISEEFFTYQNVKLCVLYSFNKLVAQRIDMMQGQMRQAARHTLTGMHSQEKDKNIMFFTKYKNLVVGELFCPIHYSCSKLSSSSTPDE